MNARGRIRADLVAESADHAPHGFVLDLADQIPQCQVEWPRASRMKLNVGQHRCMAFDIEWVFTNEVTLIVGEAVHGVARPNTAVARIVKYSNDGGRELGAWTSVPRSRKRWIKRQLVMRDLDSSNRGHGVLLN